MKFRLWKEIWTVLFAKSVGKDFVGECNHSQKTIRVLRSLRGRDRMDTLIHEMLHAVLPDEEELWVNSVASDMSQVLWEYGYRNVKEAKPKSSKQSP